MRALKTLALSLAMSLSWAAMALPALAGAAAQLRPEVVVAATRITLGDLFYDAGDASQIVVGRIAPGQTAVLDATQVQILARSNGVDWGNPAGLRRIEVQSSAPLPQTTKAGEPLKANKGAAVLTYLHSLNAGEVVRAEDLTWSREAVAGADAPRAPEAVIGMAARRPLREGEPVSVRDVAAPLVIKKDDMIAVSFAQGGLTLTLQAKAMGDASAGQSLSVLNPASKKIIEAVASGPGQALVGPEADQLKAAARASNLSSLSHLALR